MAATVCWSCNARSNMTRRGDPVSRPLELTSGPNGTVVAALFTCDNCQTAAVGTALTTEDLQRAHTDRLKSFLGEYAAGDIIWQPRTGQSRDFPNVPDHISQAASEAYECASISANRAAVLLARSVIEATAKHLGIVKGTLFSKIDEMETQGHLRKVIAEGAHSARLLGNDMAHGDFVQPIVHGHEKVPTGGQVEAPAGGHLVVPGA